MKLNHYITAQVFTSGFQAAYYTKAATEVGGETASYAEPLSIFLTIGMAVSGILANVYNPLNSESSDFAYWAKFAVPVILLVTAGLAVKAYRSKDQPSGKIILLAGLAPVIPLVYFIYDKASGDSLKLRPSGWILSVGGAVSGLLSLLEMKGDSAMDRMLARVMPLENVLMSGAGIITFSLGS